MQSLGSSFATRWLSRYSLPYTKHALPTFPVSESKISPVFKWQYSDKLTGNSLILFSQSEDGRLFQIDRPTEEQKRQAKIEARARDAAAAIEAKLWTVAIDKLQEIVALEEGAAHG